jgi:hypothetical protein
MVVISVLAGFLLISGLVFVAAALLSRLPALAFARERLELAGGFERAAALLSGLLFIASGGAVFLGVEQLR